jgi:hypothetical protein
MHNADTGWSSAVKSVCAEDRMCESCGARSQAVATGREGRARGHAYKR